MISWYLKDKIVKYIFNMNMTKRDFATDELKQRGYSMHKQELKETYEGIKDRVLEDITVEEIEEVNAKVGFTLIKR